MIGPYYVTTDERRRVAWGLPCKSPSIFGKVVIDGRTFTCNKLAVPAFEAFEQIRAKHHYHLTGNDTGFYSCRHMQHNPKLPMSVHSWAMALDINWLENPAGSKLVTDIPESMLRDLYSVKTTSGAYVFRWGADWDRDWIWEEQSYVDAMHWECVAHPLDLYTGIVWTGGNIDSGVDIVWPDEGDDEMTLKRGDRGNAVGKFQGALVKTGRNITVDKIFGPETETAVTSYQHSANLPETGHIDGVTAALLLEYVPDYN